jgi:Putative transposase of IS4/5 family (DUF4096)
MMTLVDDLVPDRLWAIVVPLLPAPPRPPYGGRRQAIPDRACFAAIVYMARTSTPWRLLPARELAHAVTIQQAGVATIALPARQLLVDLVLAGTAGLVAAAIPAHRAARLDLLTAIGVE